MNILKWEFKKRVYQLRFIVLSFIILIAVLYLLLPLLIDLIFGNITVTVLGLISVAAGLMGAYIVVVYPTLSIIIDFRREYCFLEKMHSHPFVITAGVRLLLNVLSALLGSGLLILASEAMKRFNTDNTRYLVVNLQAPFERLIFDTAVLSPAIALFSFTAALSIPIFKRHSFLKAAVIYAVCGITFLMNELPIVQCAVVILLTIASCWLYDVRYEVDY